MPQPSQLRTLTLFIFTGIAWGSGFLFIKIAVQGMSPLQYVFGRMLIAALVLSVTIWIGKRAWPHNVSAWAHVSVLGICGVFIPSLLFGFAGERIPSALSAIYNSSVPILTVLITLLALRQERVNLRKILGINLGALGILVVFSPWSLNQSDIDLIGQLCALGAVTSVGFTFAYTRKYLTPLRLDPVGIAAGQSEGVPRFAQLAKQAGVQRFVQIGSYYHQLNPAWAETDLYIGARKVADDKTRDLVGGGFQPITLNPPSIVGAIPGRSLRGFQKLIAWVRGEVEGPERYAPAGGTNYMSVRSLSQAVAGALDSGEAGKAYLVGDRNLRYNEYYNLLAEASNSPHRFEERDEEHPFLPDRFIVQGRGNAIVYEPELAVQKLLAFDRDDVERALRAIVEAADAL